MRSSSFSWKRAALVTLAVGVSVGAALVVVVASVLFWASSTADRLGEPAPMPVRRTLLLPSDTSPAPFRTVSTRASSDTSASRGEPLRLDLELRSGRFEIRRGPAGGEIEIDGSVAENYYELVERSTPADAEGGPALSVQIRARTSSLVRFMGAFGRNEHEELPNELTVTIPADLPVALSLDVTEGESVVDLGGLNLVTVTAALRMGNHRLLFSEPVAQSIDRVTLEARMGDVQVDALGNARARQFTAESRMGSFDVDLAGIWSNDTVSELDFRHAMGELVLRIPSELRIAEDSVTGATMGETTGIPDREMGRPSSAMLRLNMSTTMGATRVTRY